MAREHELFEMSERTAERWLMHMQASIDDMKDEIAEKFRIQLMDFMKYTGEMTYKILLFDFLVKSLHSLMCNILLAYYLVLVQSTQKHMEKLGPYLFEPKVDDNLNTDLIEEGK